MKKEGDSGGEEGRKWHLILFMEESDAAEGGGRARMIGLGGHVTPNAVYFGYMITFATNNLAPVFYSMLTAFLGL